MDNRIQMQNQGNTPTTHSHKLLVLTTGWVIRVQKSYFRLCFRLQNSWLEGFPGHHKAVCMTLHKVIRLPGLHITHSIKGSHSRLDMNCRRFSSLPSAYLGQATGMRALKWQNWLSHDIQNEILQVLSLTVVQNLNQDIKKNTYFVFIVDETTDNSTKEQVSISLQNVNDNFDVFEDFIGLYETSSTTGHTLAASIEDVLLMLDLPIEDYRGQCYDGATNMSGHIWTVRFKSLNLLNTQYETILSVLDSLKSKGSVANGLSAFFEKTSSLFYLEVSVIVFGITEELARNLQTSDISITSALRQTQIVMGHLTGLRTEEKFTELWEKVKKRGKDLDLQPVSLPCVLKTSTALRTQHKCITTSTMFKPRAVLETKLLLVLPATSATAERTFSAIRHLKTWLHSTMTQEHLNHIAVLAVHRDLAKDVSNLDIANKFISSKELRKLVFGHINM
ncbi:hypothetical protein PR048_023867 [Dryococelus australis]|uniref:DUF4371 domain-containing protein n=1 Tax=Dryococelus australis TaxID=614101 RepID=A0ABQ9GV90_9NEOP|nr:hypothetical protein PR048_023867 [Dryococelus australis]